MSDLRDFFKPGGVLHNVVGTRYRYRPGQVELAAEIDEACELLGGAVVLADAKTGTGKSFAYLVPIALAGERAVISTAGKVLQRQLISKDLPMLSQALTKAGAEPPSYALLKGRDNFLCPRRFEEFVKDGAAAVFEDRFEAVAEWARSTEPGMP